jgi:DNA primase
MYDRDLIEAVLKHADIVNVISSYINVIKKGKSYLALCPFHDDSNPSLNISPEKQIYKCFSCGEGGNAITFVRNYEHIGFEEAVRKVAELSSYFDPRLSAQRTLIQIDPEKEPLYKTMEDLASFYQYALSTKEGEKARHYLDSRNTPLEQREAFGIGYAPLDGVSTVKYLEAKKHSLKNIEDAGIAFAQLEGTSDRNAGRLIFPLFDPEGRTVGFSARRLEDDDSPKYVNTPETKIFHKGETLYNYHRAAKIARHEGYVYLLEGFMDVMALTKVGLESAIALCGTSLTKEHVELLRRMRAEVRVCLDGDAPGQIGMMKIISLLQKAKIPFRLVSNPLDLRDPDDILQESGPEALKEAMSHLVDPSDFALSFYLNTKKLETIEDREKVLNRFLPYCASLPHGIERENYLAKLAKATGFEVEAVRAMLGKVKPLKEDEPALAPGRSPKSVPKGAKKQTRLYRAERTILYYMLRQSEAVRYFEENLGDFYYDDNNSLANCILDYSLSHQGNVEPSQLMGLVQSLGEEESNLEDSLSELYAESEKPPYSSKTMDACKKVIEEEKKSMREREEAKKALASDNKDAQKEYLNSLARNKLERWKSQGKVKN